MGLDTDNSSKTTQLQENASYICINCGKANCKLFQDYNLGIIKIEHCVNCQNVVDKYIEYEPVLVFLDTLLLKKEAFRHVLNNRNMKGHWKLTAILLFCDAFTKLLAQNKDRNMDNLPNYVLYSAFEWGLYRNYLESLIELIIQILCILCCLSLLVRQTNLKDQVQNPNNSDVIHAVLLSNFGKILVIPGILWTTFYSNIHVQLSQLFVCAANIQALRVLYPSISVKLCILMVGLGHFISLMVSEYIRGVLSGLT